MKVDLRRISSEKNIPYSDVLWQYVTEDFLWRIDKAGLAPVLWQRKSEYATGEKLALYYVYGKPHEDADKSPGVPIELIRGIITGNAECNSHSDVIWENETLGRIPRRPTTCLSVRISMARGCRLLSG